jgi:uncharacterized protein YjiS (DUF1127 family)
MHTLHTAHNLYKQQGRVTLGTPALEAPARVAPIARRYPAPEANAPKAALLRDKHATARTELDALVLRTFVGSGFGEAVVDTNVAPAAVTSFDLYHQARANRSYQLREIVKALLQAVADAVRPAIARWREQQRARAAYRTLQALDTRTLRDLGLDRSELLSVATELAAGASSTRVRIYHR